MEKHGIKEISEIVVFGFGVFHAGVEAKKNDGKIDLNDLGLLMPIFPKLAAAVEGYENVIPEFKDLSVDEGKELLVLVAKEMNLTNDEKLKLKVEKTLVAILANYDAYKAFAA